MIKTREHILLIGGGHAHLAVLADWIKHGLPCVKATLLTPGPHLRYSGMVPGWIAGQYDRNKGTVDLVALAKRAGVDMILGKCAEIDPDSRHITTETGEKLSFDIASIDTGGVGRAARLLGEDPRMLDIRPIDRFVDTLDQIGADTSNLPRNIAVVGGGAGGTELAFVLKNWVGKGKGGLSGLSKVTFVAGSAGLLPDQSAAVRAKVAAELDRQGIAVLTENARIDDGMLFAGERSLEPVDLIFAAIGSGAPEWPRKGGLACNKAGFIAIDRYQRSISHSHIFAVGDVAARQDRNIPHSGVHAVFAGPVLAHNLRAAMAGKQTSQSYRPRWNNLYLMSTGDGSAIASYGPFAAQGRWVARLKHWIDSRWISKYAALAKPQ